MRLLVRDPVAVANDRRNVETAVVDLNHPETLVAALGGADQLFLLSPGPDTPAQDAAAIAAAKRASVRHVVEGASAAGTPAAMVEMRSEPALGTETVPRSVGYVDPADIAVFGKDAWRC